MKNFVFDGLAYAKSVINNHDIDSKNANEHMLLLAKYNFHVNKMDDASNYHAIVDYMSKYWCLFVEADHQMRIEDYDKCINKGLFVLKIVSKNVDLTNMFPHAYDGNWIRPNRELYVFKNTPLYGKWFYKRRKNGRPIYNAYCRRTKKIIKFN